MDSLPLLDTPKRQSLTSQSASLRGALKDWEKSFASTHSGRKPDKDDIKADPVIAKKYKDYSRLRDVLAGKLGTEALNESRSPHLHAKKVRADSSVGFTPRKRGLEVTPKRSRSHTLDKHPNQLDPYDPPHSASPRPFFLTSIGPTPQRDGKAMGLFDLLSNSGRSSQATPSAKKRKFEALSQDEKMADGKSLLQTPSRRQRHKGDILQFLTGDVMESANAQKHSRTPVSEGKKFMLSHFFATPSAMRYTSLEEEKTELSSKVIDSTPLNTELLGRFSPNKTVRDQPGPDATPAYLKRSYSFKERLLSASTNTATKSTTVEKSTDVSPTAIRKHPRTLQRTRSLPKPLSQIVRDLRKLEDEQLDDDLDALRELEGNAIAIPTANTLNTDEPSQFDAENQGPEKVEQVPARSWKKKGQKRTTRRSIMRPTKVMLKDEQKFVSVDDGDEYNDGSEDELTRIDETQILEDPDANLSFEESGDDLRAIEENPNAKRAGRYPSELDSADEFEGNVGYHDEDDEDDQDSDVSETKKGKRGPATKAKFSGSDVISKKQPKKKVAGTINPNAISHMNFRTLKIRNKNSKAGGRGRFGKGRR